MAGRPDYDVLIVGGGPVGLLLGNLLGNKGLRTLLVEKSAAPPTRSMAIGITPPSLELLQLLALDTEFVHSGVRVDHARVYEGQTLVGELCFRALQHPYPFILSIPQATTIRLFEARLLQEARVSLRRETRLVTAAQCGDHVTAAVQGGDDSSGERITAAFLVGCDGHRSLVREIAEIPLENERTYSPHFLMADFVDTTGLGSAAHLFFSRHGSIESFPLPQQQRRWIVQTERFSEPPDTDYLISRVRQQAGHALSKATCTGVSAFRARRFVCQRYFRGRIILCGDAAHIMSPIGGQGMNTGFADAEYLADILARHCCHGEPVPPLLSTYDHFRRIAFNAAADRAERGMWLGTRRGLAASGLRFLFTRSLLSPLFCRSLPAYFAMLTIPCRSLKAISRDDVQPIAGGTDQP